MRSLVVKALKDLHAVSVENPCGPGTPDVNYCEGWVELKALEQWPAREDTVVRVPHFTRQQRIWLTRRAAVGGNCWLLLSVERDWLLFPGIVAATILGDANKAELYEHASAAWKGTPPEKELLVWLR